MKKADMLRLIGSQVFLHATMAGCRLAAPLLALQQGYSAAAVGLLVALFAVSQVFLALPAGRYADRHGLRRPVGIAVMASMLGAGMVAAFPTFEVMCMAALVTGAATGTTVIALQRHAGRAASDIGQLKEVFSWLAIAPAVANFIGPFTAGMLIDHAGQVPADLRAFRIAFGALAMSPLLCWWMVRTAPEMPRIAAPEGQGPLRAWDLLRESMFRRLLFANWMQSTCWDVHAFVLPILGHERGIAASVIGSILGAFAIAAAAIRIVLPRLTANLPEARVILWSSCGTAVLF
ncbi:MAG: MFS transporter, partial [Ramlibacter sp.]